MRSHLALSTLLLALSLLAGCYSYSQHVTLGKDGSGTIKTLIEHEQITFSGAAEKVESRARAKCANSELGFEKIHGAEVVQCANWVEDYRVFEEAIYSFSDVSVLSTGMWSYTWERVGPLKVFTMLYETGEGAPTEQDKVDARKDMEGYRGVTFSVTLPGSIVEAPGAVVEGKTATWDYPWETVIDEGLTRLEMTAKVKLGWWERLFGG
ncbi:MAG: hypothetical protein P1S46_02415 [bacterium]|nr:hypothetical protein [bacterium]MDT8394827.1 hypothetical protein [bacterium]